jgi:hypothetical protein
LPRQLFFSTNTTTKLKADWGPAAARLFSLI